MSAQPLAIAGCGMVTGVGLDAPSSCAAIRCGIDNFQETRFRDSGGEWILGCEVALEQPWRGRTKLLQMAARAISEALAEDASIATEQFPCLLCLAEKNRAGRIVGDDDGFFVDLCQMLDQQFHPSSRVFPDGRYAFASALNEARRLLRTARYPQVLIAATDGLLLASTMVAYESDDRLLTSRNSDGFIPGEAASAVIVRRLDNTGGTRLVLRGLGMGAEAATVDSDEPLRADGLVDAIRDALSECDLHMGDVDFRVTDISGKQYYFKEASLAANRLLRTRKQVFDIWHPADCIGECGAAIGGVMTAVMDAACRKRYSRGDRILCHLGNDAGHRAAMLFEWSTTLG